jgi:molybdenum cofactor guanylyltransferase
MKSVIILCGGYGRRMGQDKGLMPFQDKPLIIHVIETVSDLVDEVILALRSKDQQNNYEKIIERYELPDIRICLDEEEDQGPLMGIYCGLGCITNDEALIIPCDSPIISNTFINNIYKYYNLIYDAAVPEWPDGKLEPLHAIYNKRITGKIAEILKNGVRDVQTLLMELDVRYIPVYSLDHSKKSFFNVNCPEDLERLEE